MAPCNGLHTAGGGGGDSYNAGANQDNAAAISTGNGQVVIAY